mmetsp:Transcript_65135/g.187443  ORF Transcript_65135/g.187443 Transcript_65135/m.187443 type:complete len:269 (+) Transcript_65135:3-809(+)
MLSDGQRAVVQVAIHSGGKALGVQAINGKQPVRAQCDGYAALPTLLVAAGLGFERHIVNGLGVPPSVVGNAEAHHRDLLAGLKHHLALLRQIGEAAPRHVLVPRTPRPADLTGVVPNPAQRDVDVALVLETSHLDDAELDARRAVLGRQPHCGRIMRRARPEHDRGRSGAGQDLVIVLTGLYALVVDGHDAVPGNNGALEVCLVEHSENRRARILEHEPWRPVDIYVELLLAAERTSFEPGNFQRPRIGRGRSLAPHGDMGATAVQQL